MKQVTEIYKDYKVNIKVRNNRILKAIEDFGGTPGDKWCKKNNLCYPSVNNLINMTASPVLPLGELSPTAKKLCELLNKLPEDLWSSEQIRPLEKNFSSFEMSNEQLISFMSLGETSYLSNFEEKIDSERLVIAMESMLNNLNDNEQIVLKGRFYQDKTLESVGEELGITRERARQIEAKALRKLRSPNRNKPLLSFLDKEPKKVEQKTQWSMA